MLKAIIDRIDIERENENIQREIDRFTLINTNDFDLTSDVDFADNRSQEKKEV